MKPETLIHRYLIGEATAEEVAELDQLLAKDSGLRRRFVLEAGNDTALREIALERQAAPSSSADRKVISPVFKPMAWIAAAAAVVLLAALSWSEFSQPRTIATLVSAEDASWESSLPTAPGSELTAGQMKLTSGIAAIRFRSGAEMMLEAPARLSIETPMMARLDSGAAVLNVPESAIGFVLETPEGRVVDHGTSFAVNVSEKDKKSTMPVDTMIASLGAGISAHTMSHYSHGERREVSEMRDLHNAKFLTSFIDKMKASKEADGSSLLDNVSLTLGMNLFSVHTLRNCPTLIAGGGAGFAQGRHLVMDDPKTPLCNLWLSQLKGCGIEAESFGDSTGVIDELFVA